MPEPEAPVPQKSGFKTTEFWITLAVTIAALVPSLGLPEEHVAVKVAGLVVAVGAQLGYAALRTAAKKA